jgi:hypothetical protein
VANPSAYPEIYKEVLSFGIVPTDIQIFHTVCNIACVDGSATVDAVGNVAAEAVLRLCPASLKESYVYFDRNEDRVRAVLSSVPLVNQVQSSSNAPGAERGHAERLGKAIEEMIENG